MLYNIPGWEEFLADFHNFLPFEEARLFARSLKLNGIADWTKWCKSGNKPDDIPSAPNFVYKDSWVSWGDFLGTGNLASKDYKFRPFEEARLFAHNLKLSSGAEWKKWSKSGKRPDDIPSDPYAVYKDSGWVGMGDWLGTGNIAPQNRKYRSFEKARKFARSLKLNGQAAWSEWCKSSDKPDDIPAAPNNIYKDSGWIGYRDFLGTGNLSPINRKFRSFKEARKYVRKLNLNSQADWNKWRKSDKRPKDIPAAPFRTYKDCGWVGMGDWLGTGNVNKKNFLPFKEARRFARNLKLSSYTAWEKWSKSGERPDNIPSSPNQIYKDSGWAGMADWLGKK